LNSLNPEARISKVETPMTQMVTDVTEFLGEWHRLSEMLS